MCRNAGWQVCCHNKRQFDMLAERQVGSLAHVQSGWQVCRKAGRELISYAVWVVMPSGKGVSRLVGR